MSGEHEYCLHCDIIELLTNNLPDGPALDGISLALLMVLRDITVAAVSNGEDGETWLKHIDQQWSELKQRLREAQYGQTSH